MSDLLGADTTGLPVLSNNSKDKEYLMEIGALFKLPGEIKKIILLKDGRLATTYRVDYNTKKSYLFQNMKIPKQMLLDSMSNSELLINYLKSRGTVSVHFHHTVNKESVVEFDKKLWRVKRYFDTYKLPQLDENKAFVELGETIGQFVLATKNFNAEQLKPLDSKSFLLKTIMPDNDSRFDETIRNRALLVEKAFDERLIPLRVVHNDLKPKTITFKDESRYFINLDLCSAGIAIYDFASIALSYCLEERAEEPGKATLNIEEYKSLLIGYLTFAGSVLNKEEKLLFPAALLAMATKRFLVGKNEKENTWWEFAIQDINQRFDEISSVSSELAEKTKARKRIKNASSVERDYSGSTSKTYKADEYMSIPIPHLIKPKGGRLYRVFKRMFDFLSSLLGIIVLSPLLLIIGLLVVSTSKGPMIYVSKRVGKDGRVFNFYKFRSMYKDAESRLNELLSQNEIEGGVTFKMKNDPRITPFGKFLRKTSIDELPQLFNVLKGDMSLIGPRAALPREVELYPEEAFDRLLVPQGLSGEWQANGRSDTTFENMIQMDLDYIENKRGFWHDICLILKTIVVVIKGSGAE